MLGYGVQLNQLCVLLLLSFAREQKFQVAHAYWCVYARMQRGGVQCLEYVRFHLTV